MFNVSLLSIIIINYLYYLYHVIPAIKQMNHKIHQVTLQEQPLCSLPELWTSKGFQCLTLSYESRSELGIERVRFNFTDIFKNKQTNIMIFHCFCPKWRYTDPHIIPGRES